jgi:uncharacterized membrane protein
VNEQLKWIAGWRAQNALAASQMPAALRLAGIPPARAEWRGWIERLLLWLGVAALLTGLVFFVAANWAGMGRFGKFALAEGALLAALAAYAGGARFRHGNAALLAASLAVGALLALIGQTYQTGADTFELFAVWAALILPWTLLARLPALWVLWLAILHVTYFFYLDAVDSFWWLGEREKNALTGMALFDCGALAAWEWCAARGWAWMRGRWVARLLALAAGAAVTALALLAVIDRHGASGYLWLYAAVLAGLAVVYRRRLPDLFMLAGVALSLIVTLTAMLARTLLYRGGIGNLTAAVFILGLCAMLMTAGAAWWLRRVARDLKTSEAQP